MLVLCMQVGAECSAITLSDPNCQLSGGLTNSASTQFMATGTSAGCALHNARHMPAGNHTKISDGRVIDPRS